MDAVNFEPVILIGVASQNCIRQSVAVGIGEIEEHHSVTRGTSGFVFVSGNSRRMTT